MKKAWIIVNQFLKTKKFSELYEYFSKAAASRNINLEIYTNAEIIPLISKEVSLPLFIIFWDKDIRLARLLESMGAKLFNNPSAIETADDKYLTYLALKKDKIPTPYTIPAPMTYENIGYSDFDFITKYGNILKYPLVIKETFGSFGEQVYLSSSPSESKIIVEKTKNKPLIFQEFIKESKGRDIRIYVCGNKVVAAMERYSDNGDFRANISIGGKMKKIELNERLCELAIAAAKALNLDFCGVDLLFNGNDYTVCEVNSNAHFKNIMDFTGINFAEEIFDYIGENI